MRVSIVTPSYNQASYLEQTILSVLGQENTSIEYFVIDGASTDSSLQIIRKYEDRLAGWVSEKDQGQADAINKGFRQVNGEIVGWLNSDDFYLPGTISRVIEAFEKNPQAGMIYGNVISVDARGNTFNLQTFKQFSLIDLMAFNIISQPAVFFRKSILEKTGLLEPSYHYLLDHQLWLRMAILAPMVYIPETLAAARYHADAKNLAKPAEFGREAFRIVEWMKSSPDFSPLFEKNRKKILAGAERFRAFYMLDGGYFREALAGYWRAFQLRPIVTLREWHRVVYCVLAMIGLSRLRNIYMQLRKKLKNYS